MNVVRPKAVILYAKLGSVYYPIACAKDCSISITSDFLELAARSSTRFREYEYSRITGKMSGTGLTVIDPESNLYTVFDLLGSQLNQTKFLVKFSIDDGVKTKVMEANVLVEEISISGSSTDFSNYNYSFQITGEVKISSSYVSDENPKIKIYEYTATGTISSLAVPITGTSTTILLAYINGVSKRIRIFPDAYAANEVQWKQSNATLYFGTNMLNTDTLKVIYVDL